LDDLTSLTNETQVINTINNNNDEITGKFANTVSRNGDEPNFMTADFDMNGFRILNSPDPILPTHLVTLQYGDANYGAAAAAAAAASATAAALSAAAAAQSAIDAANQALKLIGTSVTSNTIGAGAKTFTTQTGKYFDPGAKVLITSDANPSVDFMFGTTTLYAGGQLDVNVEAFGGSGTHSDWTIRVAGARGATGATGGGGPGTGDLLSTNNLSDLADIPTARANLGLGSAALQAITDFLQTANNLSDLADAATARNNLGLGTAAIHDVGTAPFNVVQLDANGKLPAVDGSNLTNVGAGGAGLGASTEVDTFISITSTIPRDDTIPQQTEGQEILTLEYAVASVGNSIEIVADIAVGMSASVIGASAAIFVDSAADAIAADMLHSAGSESDVGSIFVSKVITPADTNTHTYKVRVGKHSSAGSAGVNATYTGTSRLFGGARTSSLTIREIGSGTGGGGFVDIMGDTFTLNQTFPGLAFNIGSGAFYTFPTTVTFPIDGFGGLSSLTLTASASDPIDQHFSLFGTAGTGQNTFKFLAGSTTGSGFHVGGFNSVGFPSGVTLVNGDTGIRFAAGTQIYFEHEFVFGAAPTTLADVTISWIGTTAL
jgi:hypothetical protein